jgi:predicted Zn-dependent protease
VTEKQGSSFDLTWIAHGERVYRIASVTPASDFARHGETFREVAESFRPLRAEDRARIREDRLRVRPAREGESLEAFLERTGGSWSPEEAAIANGMGEDTRLGHGQLLKVPISQSYTLQSR